LQPSTPETINAFAVEKSLIFTVTDANGNDVSWHRRYECLQYCGDLYAHLPGSQPEYHLYSNGCDVVHLGRSVASLPGCHDSARRIRLGAPCCFPRTCRKGEKLMAYRS
jgi:hypothetical protein